MRATRMCDLEGDIDVSNRAFHDQLILGEPFASALVAQHFSLPLTPVRESCLPTALLLIWPPMTPSRPH